MDRLLRIGLDLLRSRRDGQAAERISISDVVYPAKPDHSWGVHRPFRLLNVRFRREGCRNVRGFLPVRTIDNRVQTRRNLYTEGCA